MGCWNGDQLQSLQATCHGMRWNADVEGGKFHPVCHRRGEQTEVSDPRWGQLIRTRKNLVIQQTHIPLTQRGIHATGEKLQRFPHPATGAERIAVSGLAGHPDHAVDHMGA